MHFGAFWRISCVTPWPLHDLYWLLSPFKCPFNPEEDHLSHSRQIWNNLLCHAMVTILVQFGAFWCILVHFGAPHEWPHDPFMTCSDSYTLSSVHLFKKWITLVTQDKLEILCSVMVQWPFWCILVHFGALRERLHHLSVLNLHQVVKNMFPTYQELLNATNSTFLSQETLI